MKEYQKNIVLSLIWITTVIYLDGRIESVYGKLEKQQEVDYRAIYSSLELINYYCEDTNKVISK